ncbi:hypothetical protein AAFF_G00006320 [Aldrovandia affinis]|uniref:Uncharacterized protein n=1 Tax=Aldrovandia affinis TaxID=143900 RepID=A0AAD7TG17_9TELE|nr:hypothetical protein AAFF_G00006320 [Aldrovandia affinis]
MDHILGDLWNEVTERSLRDKLGQIYTEVPGTRTVQNTTRGKGGEAHSGHWNLSRLIEESKEGALGLLQWKV